MDKEKEIVDFVVHELFAPDGPLQLEYDVYLKPYYKNRIHKWVRRRCKEELDIDFTDEECKLETENEFLERVVNTIQESL